MNKIHKLIAAINAPTKMIVPGAILFAMFQIPISPAQSELPSILDPMPLTAQANVSALSSDTQAGAKLVDIFLGGEVPIDQAETMVKQKMEFVSTRGAYPASLKVIQKHEKTIKQMAAKHGVPEDVAIGIGLLENGGSETAKSPAGALGVFQLMPGTAKSLGLTVNKKVDERRDPKKNIDAGMRYLATNYKRFGDWGLTTWAYHAGEGNVSKALKLYAKANHGINLKGLKDASEMKSYVEKHNVTIHKLLSDPAVKTLTKKLNDDSAGYPYKVIATATLFKNASGIQTASR